MQKNEVVTAVESNHIMVSKERILEIIDDTYPTIIEFSNDQKNNILFLVGEEEREINTSIISKDEEGENDKFWQKNINNQGSLS